MPETPQQADDSEEDAPGLTFSSFSGHVALLDSKPEDPEPQVQRSRSPVHSRVRVPPATQQSHVPKHGRAPMTPFEPEQPSYSTKRDWPTLHQNHLNVVEHEEAGTGPPRKVHRANQTMQNQPVKNQEKAEKVPEMERVRATAPETLEEAAPGIRRRNARQHPAKVEEGLRVNYYFFQSIFLAWQVFSFCFSRISKLRCLSRFL